jgi:hypothetical protein
MVGGADAALGPRRAPRDDRWLKGSGVCRGVGSLIRAATPAARPAGGLFSSVFSVSV